MVDAQRVVVLHARAAVVADADRLISLDRHAHVALGMQVEGFAALLVLELQRVGVGRRALLARPCDKAALRGVVGHLEGRRVVAVVDAAGDDGLVGVALEKVDDDLVADARREERAEVLPGPDLGHADQARALLVLLAAPVPVELHAHAAELVGMDLVAVFAHHDGRLRPAHLRLGRAPWRAELLRRRQRLELDVKARAAALPRVEAAVAGLHLVAGDEVLRVLIGTRVAAHGEGEAVAQAVRVGRTAEDLEARLHLVAPVLEVMQALRGLHEAAGIVEDFAVGLLVCAHQVAIDEEVALGDLEVEVLDRELARLHRSRHGPAADEVHIGRRLLASAEEGQIVGAVGLRVVCAGRVDEHELVLAVAVLEAVVDAFVLKQPTDEIEVALAVLHAVLALAVLAKNLEVVHGDGVVVEHQLDDVGHLHVLEDAAVHRAREEPQPGPHDGLVTMEAPRRAGQRKARDKAVQVAQRVAPQRDLDGHALAEDEVGVEVGARAQQRGADLAERAEGLAAAEGLQQQISRAEGVGLDAKGLRHGRVWRAR